MAAIASAVRAEAWWEPKLAPLLGTGYATAFFVKAAVLSVAPSLLLAIAAILPGAMYVAFINDFTDVVDDLAAGKQIGFAARHRAVAIGVIVACLLAGALFSVFAWRDDPFALVCYVGSWVAFSMYSLPPVRLKARGLLGIVADALGAHLFPQLLMAAVVFHHVGRNIDVAWAVLLGTWTLAYGLRSILIHQLEDRWADEASGVRSFGARWPLLSRTVGSYVLFPIELGAFLGLMLYAKNPLALVLLATYGLLDLLRIRVLEMRLRVISSAQALIVMHDYYLVLYPMAFVAASSIRHHRDAWVLMAQALMFPFALTRVCSQSTMIGRSLFLGLVERLR